ncbi:MAG: SIMPL domain-containing protein [Eubacteriales bacterium]|nr:SIMPL domain-containing protein [Eubacteriales bacterium]
MKKFLVLLLSISLCLTAVPALAESAAQTVSATGTATVTIAPDMATFTAGVRTDDTQVSAALESNSTAMQAVLAALKAMGVDAQDLQTQTYSVSPNYSYSDNGQETLTGYVVTNVVTVTVRNLDQLSALLDAAVAAGANQTYGVDLASTHQDEAYEQALQAATKNAVRKAGLIAGALGREAGDVISVTEADNSYYFSTNSRSVAYAMDSGATPIENGILSVTATVDAVVALQ